MKYSKKMNKALGVLVLTTFLFGGLSSIAIGRVSAEQPRATLHMQGQNPLPVVNINKASATELDTIRGIGPALAERIIKYREQNGAFKTVEDLTKVSGINGSKFKKIKEQVTV
ncbi:MAG TPA: helix-hairpin-helix domain-containing protein [Candidatus Omnitrophota bacterium]|nr:helix-hairpin-helix domain-containing protein [Candidatus Omnitrophota bacterium]